MAHQHPGKTLLDQYLKPQQLSQNRLARLIFVPPRRINEIILGKRAISADTAVRLGCYFGNSASYWLHLQAAYDIELARDKIGSRLHQIQPPYTIEPAPHQQRESTDDATATIAAEPDSQHKPAIRRRMMR